MRTPTLKTGVTYTLELFKYTWSGPNKHKTIKVTLVEIPHWNTFEPSFKRFKIMATNGRELGRIERSLASTDRHYGRIRVPGRGRLAWYPDGKKAVKIHCDNKLTAVAYALGFDSATIKEGS